MASFLFDFEVPPRLIAQEPIEPRDQSRLLAVSRSNQAVARRRFFDLPELLHPGDLLVLNDTRVLHARVLGRRLATGGKWEGLFLRAWPDGTWEMLSQTRGQPKPGEVIAMDPAPLELKLVSKQADGRWLVQPNLPGSAAAILEQAGRVPLPPYIRKGRALPQDRSRYQTVFARKDGAVAAPTAGLHFTPAVFERLAKRGISWTFVTLHVGLGTFQPMQTEDPAQHVMHREWGELSNDAARAIAQRQAAGGRIVAVGTTSVRVLETVARTGPIRPWSGETDLFVYPPFTFSVVDVMITNFHFPRTTLLLLVGAFAGVPLLEQAYRIAIEENYRFFSYGDAMLIE
ncbi:MAG TPA: tRNA preQ1(34) S-adenosylmethionine ribosyltransferase-isomerase QueA [Gemmataceae bacterium]|nr:tRNA preQ1(34) S-adenosylmethionine ribosyltransferase-isomerase QueA [Gemmataceae bacterium]